MATISGTVLDQSGATVAGASVKIEDQVKNVLVREARTDARGRFEALYLQPGVYTVRVEAAGFKTLSRAGVTLDVNTKVFDDNFQLEVGGVTETVSVTSDIPLVQTSTSEKSFLVEQKQIADLPINGRYFNALVATLPGVTDNGQSNFNIQNGTYLSNLHIAGGRGSQNQVYLDGQPNLTGGDSSAVFVAPSLDSLSEFKVQMNNFSAEYGRNGGAVIAVQVRSGSDSFHGAVYDYVRNDAFDAKNRILGPSSLKDRLRYNQVGGNMGGWLWIPKVSTPAHKRVFVFFSREQTDRTISQGNSLFYDLPGPDIMSNGNFSSWLLNTNMTYAPQFKNGTIFQPGTIKRDGAGNITDGTPFPGNVVPKSMWTSQSAAFVNLLTSGIPNYKSLPAAPNPGYVRDYYVTPTPFSKAQDILRIDIPLGSKNTAFFRWGDDNYRNVNPNAPQRPLAIDDPKGGSAWLLNYVRVWTPAIATETIVTYNRLTEIQWPIGGASSPWSITQLPGFNQLYPSANIINVVPNLTASPFSVDWGALGFDIDDKAYGFNQNLSWVRGSHIMKFGFYYFRDRKFNGGNVTRAQGTLNFNPISSMPNDTGNGLANLMLGNFQSYTQPNVFVNAILGYENHEGFVQDSWKISKRFTLEMGVRFQRNTNAHTVLSGGPYGTDGNFSSWNVYLTQYDPAKAPKIDLSTGLIAGNALSQLSQEGLVQEGAPGIPAGFAPAENLWAPRLGFAYDVFGNGKTALRGGAGVFYDRLRQNTFGQQAYAHWPNITSATALNGNLSRVDTSVAQGAAPAIAPPSFQIFARESVAPAIYQWNAGLQQQLKYGMVLDVSYVGSHGTHLMDLRLTNGLAAGTFIKYPTLSSAVNFKNDALRPYLGWGSLTAVETASTSSYEAMLVRLSRRFSRGLSVNVSYTWSRDFSDVNEDTDTIVNSFDRHAGWSPVSFDRTNILTIDYAYEFPKVRGSLNNPFGRAVLNGWQITGVTSFQTGLPFSVTSNGSLMGLDAGTQFPDVVGNPYAGQTSTQWLNPAAFARPADGSYGNLHRDALRLPGINNWDASLSRRIPISERVRLLFRADVFNVMNHPQIWTINTGFSADNPGARISTSNRTFGQPTSYRDPRIFQFSGKLTF